jgi:hypothetical protein
MALKMDNATNLEKSMQDEEEQEEVEDAAAEVQPGSKDAA